MYVRGNEKKYETRIGLQLRLAPEDLAKAAQAKFADVIKAG